MRIHGGFLRNSEKKRESEAFFSGIRRKNENPRRLSPEFGEKMRIRGGFLRIMEKK